MESAPGARDLNERDEQAAGASATGADRVSPHRVRIVDAALACLALGGTTKTTVDDIARQAGLSRATVYRVFAGGRDEILGAVVDTELGRLFAALGARMGAADDLGEVLAVGVCEAVTRIDRHPALRYLVEHEPATVLGHLAFDASNRLLAAATGFVAPFLVRWMDPDEACRVAEWATRIVLSYTISPSPETDLTDIDDARRLVGTFVLPGIRALRAPDRSAPIALGPFAAGDEPGPSPTTRRRSARRQGVTGPARRLPSSHTPPHTNRPQGETS